MLWRQQITINGEMYTKNIEVYCAKQRNSYMLTDFFHVSLVSLYLIHSYQL